MIDCGRQFDARSALPIVEQLTPLSPYWIEEPVDSDSVQAWKVVPASTKARLAGGELLHSLSAFEAFLDRSGADVVMPDVKYCGGLSALAAIAARAEGEGVVVSPHNPDGPLATVATLHASSTIRNLDMVEYAWNEVTWRNDLLLQGERLENGEFRLPEGVGFGVDLNETLARDHSSSVVNWGVVW